MNIDQTKEYIKQAHSGQTRFDGTEYYKHPIEVSNLTINLFNADEIIIKIALLHDVIEDCNITYKQLNENFNEFIVNSVIELTHEYCESYTEYINRIIKSNNSEVMIVKYCDLTHNLSDCYTNKKRHKQRIDKYELAKYIIEMKLNELGISKNRGVFT